MVKNMKRIIMHIDVNNAFLSWTAVDLLKKESKYDIRNSYAVIGGDPKKRSGIVLAKSTPAKKMGVVTGETLYSAKKKCPALRSYYADYKLYSTMSYAFVKILKKYTPDVEQVSVDECFLDYGKVKELYGDPYLFAKKIQTEIYETLGFTVNVGIANNKLCAKMASDFSKPNKIHTLYEEEIKEKMWPLPIGDLFGIGKRSAEKLVQLQIHTIGDLAKADPLNLSKIFKNQAHEMIKWANGIDDSEVDSTYSEPKGIGNETTIDHDVTNKQELHAYLLGLAENVALRLRKNKKYARVVVVTLKDNTFKRFSHQKKLINETCNTKEIYEASLRVLDEIKIENPIRLIGIRLDHLTTTSNHQVSLFENLEEHDQGEQLDKVLDQLKNKYGSKIIKKAGLDDSILRKKADL